jgi:hypothetical protein
MSITDTLILVTALLTGMAILWLATWLSSLDKDEDDDTDKL